MRRRRMLGGGFSPLSLFTGGVVGAWYDPSDLTTLFQDSAGTTPVTAVEQTVGLMLDKSKALALGSDVVTNGDFSSGSTGWTTGTGWAISSGVATHTGAVAGYLSQSSKVTIGKTYQLTITITASDGRGLQLIGAFWSPGVTIGSSAGTYIVHATALSADIWLYANTAGTSISIDNVSIKELAGNHAMQATSNSRPTYSARYNVLNSTATLSTQSVTTIAGSYKLSFSGAGSITLSGTATGTYTAGTNTITCTAGTLTLTVTGSVTVADLRLSSTQSTFPAYQAVVSSTNYDTAGFLPYLKFDGSDDGMATPSINFTGGDSMFVCAGITKLSDAAAGTVVELSASVASNNGTFLLSAPGSAAANLNFTSKGTTQVDNTVTTYAAPTTRVISGVSDISTPSNLVRVNGADVATVTTSQGTGNYGTFPLYIGRRGGTTLPFNGRMYSLIVAAKAASAAEISKTEVWVNQRTGAY